MTANFIPASLATFALLLVAVTATRLGEEGRKLQDAPIVDIDNCFSGSVMVETQDKGPVAMEDLQVGDYILSNAEDAAYQRVYSFAHREPSTKDTFVVIHTDMDAAKNKLEVTKDHLVFVAGKTVPVRSGTLQVGDKLTSGATITKITTTTKTGIYTPLTADGTFLVNGNKMSSYAALVQHDTTSEYGQLADGTNLPVSWHDGIHVLIVPFRLYCTSILASAGVCDAYMENGMPWYVAKGIDILAWLDQQAVTVQVPAFVAAIPVFGMLMALEKLGLFLSVVLLAGYVAKKTILTKVGLKVKMV